MGNSLEVYAQDESLPTKRECVTKKETERGHMIRNGNDKYSFEKVPSNIKFGVSSMQGWRPSMEDSHIISPYLEVQGADGSRRVLADHALFCVFDGHGGRFTSEFVGKHFQKFLTKRSEWSQYLNLSREGRKDVPGVTLLKRAMKGAFYDIDKELKLQHIKRLNMLLAASSILPRGQQLNKTSNPVSTETRDSSNSSKENLDMSPSSISSLLQPKFFLDRSGSTALTVLLTPSHIICCNLGDSRAFLCRGSTPYPLSFDHKPNNARETMRIYEAGGFVKMKRIDGDLAVSRGLGDFRYKSNSKLGLHQQKVSSDPEILVYPRDDKNDEFVVLGCDGIWDVIDNKECANLVHELHKVHPNDIGKVCEEVLDVCLKKDSRDNMTVTVLTMPAITH